MTLSQRNLYYGMIEDLRGRFLPGETLTGVLKKYDEDFDIGDQVIVVIPKYDYERKLVYGKIVAKW